jgi:predicted permease
VNTILTVLEIVAPVFLLAGVGWVWVKLGQEYRIRFVTQLSMTLGVPCLIFTSLQKTQLDTGALSTLTLAAILSYVGVTFGAWVVVRVSGVDSRTYLAPLIFGNTGNLGLPLALFAFGQEGLSLAVVVFAVMAIYSFTAGVWLVSGGGSPAKALKEPMVWATILGAVFLWQGWHTPLFLTNTLELIGQLAIPLMLITLGVALARLAPTSFVMPSILSLAKVGFCVAISWAVGLWFALPPVAFGVLVLQVSTPVAVTSYLLAEKYGADAEAVAGLVVLSTLISVLALPLILAFVI